MQNRQFINSSFISTHDDEVDTTPTGEPKIHQSNTLFFQHLIF